METEVKGISTEELKQLIRDVALIKEILLFNKSLKDPEGELSDWAKKELIEARKIPISEKISHEEVKKRILARWVIL